MNPSLLFHYGGSKLHVETVHADEDQVTFNFSVEQVNGKGFLKLDTIETQELMNWLQAQMNAIEHNKKQKE